ncbi:MAG: DUF1819 family protein [Chloroflexota bacterium]|nr:DUF1819 family protein [Chloroflexota bacterium]
MIDLDNQPFDARVAAAGSRRIELFALLAAAPLGASLIEMRRLIDDDNIAGKGSAVSREKVWQQLRQRYLLDWNDPVFVAFAEAFHATANVGDRGLLCYLLFAATNRVFREATLRCIVPLLGRAGAAVPISGVRGEIETMVREQHLHWAESTIEKVAQNLLAALRDFGLLRGGTKKVTVRPRVTPVVTWYAARLAELAGCTAQQTPDFVGFRLLGLDRAAAIDALYAAGTAGALAFRLLADVAELSLAPLTHSAVLEGGDATHAR